MTENRPARVIVESPYAGETPEIVRRNEAYARACMRDALMRGEAPFAGHLLYTQPGVIDDKITAERAMGIAAHLSWMGNAEYCVVYTDLGITKGMKQGIERAGSINLPVYYRLLAEMSFRTFYVCQKSSQ